MPESAFTKRLHEVALRAGEEFTFEGNEGEMGYELEYLGHLASNYPWIYVDFKVGGAMPLEHLVEVERRIKAACDKSESVASYLTTTLTRHGIRYRLIHREDMLKKIPTQLTTEPGV